MNDRQMYGEDTWMGQQDKAELEITIPRPPSASKRSMSASKALNSPRAYVPSRPPLLRDLEEFLSANLSEIPQGEDITQDWLSNKRLRIYREAFQMYIDEFNIYKPFLNAVKYEYESTLDFFSSRARNYISLKTDIVSKEREYIQKMKVKDAAHEEVVSDLKIAKNALERQVEDRDKTITMLQNQIHTLKANAGKTDSDMAEVKVSCITLTNALNRLEEEKKKLAGRDGAKQTEIMTLKVSLQKANSDLERLRLQLHDLESEQSSLISVDTVEKHLTRIQELQDLLKQKEEQHKGLIQRYSLLKNAIEKAFSIQNPQDIIKIENLDWSDKKIAKQVESILEKNRELGPRQIMEAFIDKIVEQHKEISIYTAAEDLDDKDKGPKEDGNDGIVDDNEDGDDDEKFESPWTHFQGLGLESSVPSYLRCTGKVQNQCFSKKETEMHLNDIWIAKEAYEEEAMAELKGKEGDGVDIDLIEGIDTSGVTPGKIHLKDFFSIYLEQKFKTTSRAVEFAYNYLDSLKKYDFDTDLKLFLMIMNGELAEEIRHDQLTLLNNLVDEFAREESTIRMPVEGRLPMDSFMRAIRRIIPTKGEHALRRLQKALDLEMKGKKYVLYNEILEEDEQGNQGRFCETLRMQHVKECTAFSNHVMEVIDQFGEEDETNVDGEGSGIPPLASLGLSSHDGDKKMRVHRFRDALVFADPDNPRAGVNRLLARGCGVSVEEMLLMEGRSVQVSIETFKQNLKKGLLKKSYPNGGGGEQGRGKLQF